MLYQPDDRVVTVKQAPHYNEDGTQAGMENLQGTVVDSFTNSSGLVIYRIMTKHGIIVEPENQLNRLD